MTDLISRLEAAEGPSRELDAEITRSLYREAGAAVSDDFEFEAVWKYTSSVDDALTLVPEGYSVELGVYVEDELYEGPEPGVYVRVSKYCMGDGPGWEADVKAATPALAICIAALKARGGD